MPRPVIDIEDPDHDWVFDRRHNSHPWGGALTDLEGSGDPTRRAVGKNWQIDHRVPKNREKIMLEGTLGSGYENGNQWTEEVNNYWQEFFCRPASPSPTAKACVLFDECNASNQLSRIKTPGFEQFIHVESFTRLLWRLTGGEYSYGRLFMTMRDRYGLVLPTRRPSGATWTEFKEQINDCAKEVNELGDGVIGELTSLLMQALGVRRPPWWGCFAEEVRPYLEKEDWASLRRVLGLGHLEDGEWLIIFRYEAADVSPLYRPTVIESNLNPFHFPAPPSSKVGITMPLDRVLPVCREIIHRPLEPDLAAKRCLGKLGQINDGEALLDYAKISQRRLEHAEKIGNEHPSERDQNWLQRHTP